MFWIAVGAVLVVSGLAIVAMAVRGARRGASGASGLAIAVGGGLTIWGAIALVVGLATRG
jgi:hypothetical protein